MVSAIGERNELLNVCIRISEQPINDRKSGIRISVKYVRGGTMANQVCNNKVPWPTITFTYRFSTKVIDSSI